MFHQVTAPDGLVHALCYIVGTSLLHWVPTLCKRLARSSSKNVNHDYLLDKHIVNKMCAKMQSYSMLIPKTRQSFNQLTNKLTDKANTRDTLHLT